MEVKITKAVLALFLVLVGLTVYFSIRLENRVIELANTGRLFNKTTQNPISLSFESQNGLNLAFKNGAQVLIELQDEQEVYYIDYNGVKPVYLVRFDIFGFGKRQTAIVFEGVSYPVPYFELLN